MPCFTTAGIPYAFLRNAYLHIAICTYATKKGISILHLTDAAAPALMIAYAIGRIGCQVAGDGDWGIYNSAYISDTPGHVVAATPQQFNTKLQQNAAYFLNGSVTDPSGNTINVTDRHAESLDKVPHKSFKGPSFLPKMDVCIYLSS